MKLVIPPRYVLLLVVLLLVTSNFSYAQTTLRLLSTSTTDNSGILSYLISRFKSETDIQVYVVATGTGQAIRAASKGDGDLLIVHDKASEIAFVNSGVGINRREFMFNDFILVGPKDDPVKVSRAGDIFSAMNVLYKQRNNSSTHVFLSRGDDSGTHKRELAIWNTLGVKDFNDLGKTYRETGAGMGKTLNIAAALNAYTLVDRGTWLSFNNRQELAILVEDEEALFNQYSVIEINPKVHSHIKVESAKRLSDWLVSKAGQKAIGTYKINGKNLFYPNYQKREK